MAAQTRKGKYFYIRSNQNVDFILDIRQAVNKPGTEVVLADVLPDSEPHDHQLWYFDKMTIRNKMNEFCLDLDDNLVVANPFVTNARSQRWLYKDETIQSEEDFEAVLGIENCEATAGARIRLAQNDNHEAQHWTIDYRPPLYFLIKSLSPKAKGKVIDIKKADIKPAAKVVLAVDKENFAPSQMWYEDQTGVIRSKLNGYALDSGLEKVVVTMPFEEKEGQQWTVSGSQIVNRYSPSKVIAFKSSNIVAVDHIGGEPSQEWDFYILPDQEFSINHSGNGKYFTIQNRHNDHFLKVRSNGAVVTTTDDDETDDKLFYSDEPSGTIRSRLNDYCFDLKEEVIVVKRHDPAKSSQKWRVTGKKIQSIDNPTQVIEASTEECGDGEFVVCVAEDNGELNQHWEVDNVQAKPFYVQSVMSKRVIEVQGAKTLAGTGVVIYEIRDNAPPNQLWYEDERGCIRSKMNGFVLDGSGKVVVVQPCDPDDQKQQWEFVEDKVQNKHNSKWVLDIKGDSKKNGATVITCVQTEGDKGQQWQKVYL